MNTELRRHMRRMLNRGNAERIAKFITASTIADWAAIPPAFITVDMTWNCNYECQGCIDTKAIDGADVVRKRQGDDPLRPVPARCSGPCLRSEVVQGVVEFVKQSHLRGIQLMGGETLLHPKIDDILETISSNGIPVEMVTNGSLISQHLASLARMLAVQGSSLRVSINGWENYGQRVGWPEQGDDLRQNVIEGIRQLLAMVPEDRRHAIYVSTVAFRDALQDLEKIVTGLSQAGVSHMVVIRERAPDEKGFIPGQEAVRDETLERVRRIEASLPDPKPEISIADNILVEPIPQEKFYRPCPSVILKTLLGADGYLYACTDHRGCKYARLVNIADYDDDIQKAWKSEQRITAALNYLPSLHCRRIVCHRYEGNTVLSLLRSDHPAWTF